MISLFKLCQQKLLIWKIQYRISSTNSKNILADLLSFEAAQSAKLELQIQFAKRLSCASYLKFKESKQDIAADTSGGSNIYVSGKFCAGISFGINFDSVHFIVKNRYT